MGIYPRWSGTDEKTIIRLYYAEVDIDDIAKQVGRGALQVIIRLVQLKILPPETLKMIWDDYSKREEAA